MGAWALVFSEAFYHCASKSNLGNFMEKPWQTDDWFVSPYNFEGIPAIKSKPPKTLTFHDVTMRDGEQQAGVVLTKHDKVAMGRALNRAGIDRIEVGIPGTSLEDREAMRALIAASLDADLYSWCRNNKLDIVAAKECGSYGITIELPASDVMMRGAYSTTLDEMLSKALENADYARSEGMKVLLLLVDATRAEFGVLKRIVQEADKACDSLAISDSFGVATPAAIYALASKFKDMTTKPLEIHCHNDFGLATANTLAAVAAGVSVAHVTVNGMGERAGNTSLGEVALGAKLLMGIDVGVKLDELYRLSKTVASISGFAVPPNKPIVGENVFNVESAQSAQWLSSPTKGAMAYPFRGELIGHPEFRLILSKKSGPHNLDLKLHELGLSVPKDRYPEILGRIYEKSLQKRGAVSDDEFIEILQDLDLYK